MANLYPKLQFLVPGGKKRLTTPKVKRQYSLTETAAEGLEAVARQYGLVRDEKGDVSLLLELIGNGNLLIVPMPPKVNEPIED